MLLNIGSIFIIQGGGRILQGKQGETKGGSRDEWEESWKEGRGRRLKIMEKN